MDPTESNDASRAKELSKLFGGNVLSEKQQVQLAAKKLAEYREKDKLVPGGLVTNPQQLPRDGN